VHERFTSLMSLALDGVATSREMEALHRHLAVCSACVEVWQHWQAVDQVLSTAPIAVPSCSLAARIMRRLEVSS
jgi:hypothetical protein